MTDATAATTGATGLTGAADLLADGIYRDATIGRWTRMALAGAAVLALFSIAAVAGSPLAVVVLAAIAAVLLVVRSVLARPRLIVRPEGLIVVRRMGRSFLAWSEVAWAGGVSAPPPLGQLEQVLAVRSTSGQQLRVPSLRDVIDRSRDEAPKVAELAASLLARAVWSTSDS